MMQEREREESLDSAVFHVSRANDRGREKTPNRQEKPRDEAAAKENAEPHLEEREVAPERPVAPAHTPEGDQNPGN